MNRSPHARPPRVLAVYKKSAYEIYVRERHNARVEALLQEGSDSVRNLMRAHEAHKRAMEEARRVLAASGARATFRYRTGPVGGEEFDLILTIGGDGTLLWASRLAGADVPMLAINSAPDHSVGFFTAGTTEDMQDVLADALAGRLAETRLTRMRVDVDGERVSNRILNDVLFAHHCPAATTRFSLTDGGQSAEYKCSGLWVSTAAGSTGALRSAGGRVMPAGSRRLQYLVREPYRPPGAPPVTAGGFVAAGDTLAVESHIRTGRLYVDGPHEARTIDIGARIEMGRSDEPLGLLGFRAQVPEP